MSRPRIRTLKPDCWADEAISPLSRGARLLFVVLVTFADDDGRFRDLPAQIIGHGYPEDTDITARKVTAWMDELVAGGIVVRYEVGGKRYATFPKWHAHQRINRWTPSQLPQCPITTGVVIVQHEKDTGSVSNHGALTERSQRKAPHTHDNGTAGSLPDRECGLGSEEYGGFRDAVGVVEEVGARASNHVDSRRAA